MANANIIPAKTKTVEVKPEEIILTLTRAEAEYIAKITGMDTSIGTGWDIFDALCSQGIKGTDGVLGHNLRNKLGLP